MKIRNTNRTKLRTLLLIQDELLLNASRLKCINTCLIKGNVKMKILSHKFFIIIVWHLNVAVTTFNNVYTH